MADLLSVDEALKRILNQVSPLPAEFIPLVAGYNRILAQDISATVSLPPFANSSMDGYAVRAEDITTATTNTPVSLTVVMDIPAGVFPQGTIKAGEAARIMTGAPIPQGATAIIPVENTDGGWDKTTPSALNTSVKIFRAVKSGDYIRPIGEDIQAGEVIAKMGDRLRPQEIGIFASLGMTTIPVFRRPRIVILSNGDELAELGQPLAQGQIYDSNRYTLAGLVLACDAEPILLPTAKDTPESIRALFAEAIALKPDMLISTAGVSVGAADFIRDILTELGAVDFWRINIRPGKPLAFGHIAGIPFFGLPGNPVSAMVTFEVFVRPAIYHMLSKALPIATINARLTHTITSDGRESYLRVFLEKTGNGTWSATLTGTQTSSALISMAKADGLLIIPAGTITAHEGEFYRVRLLKSELLYSN
ncbi:MAG: molybdopterin molybdotransferase MoeA [bacterium]|nr:molybdopterin molybdotransferase MoeA [bacterium]